MSKLTILFLVCCIGFSCTLAERSKYIRSSNIDFGARFTIKHTNWSNYIDEKEGLPSHWFTGNRVAVLRTDKRHWVKMARIMPGFSYQKGELHGYFEIWEYMDNGEFERKSPAGGYKGTKSVIADVSRNGYSITITDFIE